MKYKIVCKICHTPFVEVEVFCELSDSEKESFESAYIHSECTSSGDLEEENE